MEMWGLIITEKNENIKEALANLSQTFHFCKQIIELNRVIEKPV